MNKLQYKLQEYPGITGSVVGGDLTLVDAPEGLSPGEAAWLPGCGYDLYQSGGALTTGGNALRSTAFPLQANAYP